jgi:hypothetical protein
VTRIHDTGAGFCLEGETTREVANAAGRHHRQTRKVWVVSALTAAVVGGGAGYLVGRAIGEGAAEAEGRRKLEQRETMLVAAIHQKDEAIQSCQQVIHDATRVIRARTLYIDNMYEDAFDDASDAYELGAAGDEDAFVGGLLRSLYDQSQTEVFVASELRTNGWTGWADEELLSSCQAAPLGVPLAGAR